MLPQSLAEKLLQIRPPIIAGGLLLLALLLHFAVPVWGFFNLSVPDVGVIFALAGTGLIIWAFILFQIHKNDINPLSETSSLLITGGPYAVTRNPMYLGMAIILLGAALYFGTLPFYAAAVLFYFILNSAHIPFEEHKLEGQFGEAFRSYLRRTRRWI